MRSIDEALQFTQNHDARRQCLPAVLFSSRTARPCAQMWSLILAKVASVLRALRPGHWFGPPSKRPHLRGCDAPFLAPKKWPRHEAHVDLSAQKHRANPPTPPEKFPALVAPRRIHPRARAPATPSSPQPRSGRLGRYHQNLLAARKRRGESS